MEMTFHHDLKSSGQDQKDVLYFAFTYPYTLEDTERSMEQVRVRFEEKGGLYFHKETLIQSIEGRPMDLFTLTSSVKCIDITEQTIEDGYLYPDKEQ